MEQVSWSFDPTTRRKIIKSLWIGAFAPAIVFFLEQLGQIHFHTDKPQIDFVLIYVLPILINTAIEFVKGKSSSEDGQ